MAIPPVPNAISADHLMAHGAAARCASGLLIRSPKTGERLLICALTDLDGTVNDEHAVEHQRLATIGPARQAFGILAQSGIVTGICTARSSGEARHYRGALNISGPIISENGAVIDFPDGSQQVFGDLKQLARAVDQISRRLGHPIVNSLDFPGLEAAWLKERRGASGLYLGHADSESLRRAADRRASCFLSGLSPDEKAVAAQVASQMELDCFGELLHLIPAGANKGRALAVLNQHLLQTPGPAGLRPEKVVHIVFGNGQNDLPLFEQALQSGGAAVLVGDATTSNGFHFDLSKHAVPPGFITLAGVSHGHGILRSLPLLADFFAARYGIDFPWRVP